MLLLLAEHVDAEDLNRYRPAVRGNAEYLASLDETAPVGSSDQA